MAIGPAFGVIKDSRESAIKYFLDDLQITIMQKAGTPVSVVALRKSLQEIGYKVSEIEDVLEFLSGRRLIYRNSEKLLSLALQRSLRIDP